MIPVKKLTTILSNIPDDAKVHIHENGCNVDVLIQYCDGRVGMVSDTIHEFVSTNEDCAEYAKNIKEEIAEVIYKRAIKRCILCSPELLEEEINSIVNKYLLVGDKNEKIRFAE